jgi:hypothetical protein
MKKLLDLFSLFKYIQYPISEKSPLYRSILFINHSYGTE